MLLSTPKIWKRMFLSAILGKKKHYSTVSPGSVSRWHRLGCQPLSYLGDSQHGGPSLRRHPRHLATAAARGSWTLGVRRDFQNNQMYRWFKKNYISSTGSNTNEISFEIDIIFTPKHKFDVPGFLHVNTLAHLRMSFGWTAAPWSLVTFVPWQCCNMPQCRYLVVRKARWDRGGPAQIVVRYSSKPRISLEDEKECPNNKFKRF